MLSTDSSVATFLSSGSPSLAGGMGSGTTTVTTRPAPEAETTPKPDEGLATAQPSRVRQESPIQFDQNATSYSLKRGDTFGKVAKKYAEAKGIAFYQAFEVLADANGLPRRMSDRAYSRLDIGLEITLPENPSAAPVTDSPLFRSEAAQATLAQGLVEEGRWPGISDDIPGIGVPIHVSEITEGVVEGAVAATIVSAETMIAAPEDAVALPGEMPTSPETNGHEESRRSSRRARRREGEEPTVQSAATEESDALTFTDAEAMIRDYEDLIRDTLLASPGRLEVEQQLVADGLLGRVRFTPENLPGLPTSQDGVDGFISSLGDLSKTESGMIKMLIESSDLDDESLRKTIAYVASGSHNDENPSHNFVTSQMLEHALHFALTNTVSRFSDALVDASE